MIKILSRERCFVGAPLNFAERITAHEALPNTSYWRGFYFWRMPMDDYSKRMQERIRKADRADRIHSYICLGSILVILGLAVYGAYKLLMG
ncbi:TPA: hypothetical protein JI136_03355 [Acinetobacter baumannii]|uniref:hypothetical protein n=1 Tax=Acinetobacter baumannii TaxID=470 RepID=UPI000DEFCD48|nr:hypothetical protein [Acinetobacter baumannii]MCW8719505.1 hypothetical protein [Acinetobacter baumannii]HAV5698308.1 hypothetical protein [Acinetobacter baumannii]HAV5725481.1 hypothetical protein [Acinetobacter baumannii]HAV5729807.1 hypothetical protein [Acinetobacter baumannii]